MAKKRSKSYSRTKGHKFEQKIAKELRELGFNVVTSRSESKSMDDNKVDLVDKDNKLPCAIQLKATQAIPSYFAIRNQSTVLNEDFVIL
jgi:Holliday junction resolvase